MRVVPSSLFAAPPITRTVSPHQALRARSLRGKPCIEPFSSLLLRPVQDPSTDARDDKGDFCFQRSFGSPFTWLPKVSKNFLGRGAAGAAGEAANVVRRQPKRLAATSSGWHKGENLLAQGDRGRMQTFFDTSKFLHFTLYILHLQMRSFVALLLGLPGEARAFVFQPKKQASFGGQGNIVSMKARRHRAARRFPTKRSRA